jgi:peptidoglycan/xylan/chitin deacetylase (PgdA/CDA1 family)
MFRFDRFFTLYFFHPLTNKNRPPNRTKTPILMYHGIIDSDLKNVQPYFETTTSPAIFAEQMRFLKDNNYKIVGLDDLKDIFQHPKSNENKFAVITFDDGLLSFYHKAFPILERNGFAAVVYLPSGLIDRENDNGKYMSWTQLHQLKQKGVVFGSHSVSHPELIRLDWDSIEFEIINSKKMIEKQLDVPVDSFSYPFAFPVQDSFFIYQYRVALKKGGYNTGVTTLVGRSSMGDYPFLLKRLPINTYDDLRLFSAKLEGAYDWVYNMQLAFKLVMGKRNRQNKNS